MLYLIQTSTDHFHVEAESHTLEDGVLTLHHTVEGLTADIFDVGLWVQAGIVSGSTMINLEHVKEK